jgi:DNA polymerase
LIGGFNRQFRVSYVAFHRKANGESTRNPAPAKSPRAVPWLDAEIQVVKPKVLVCLGASAAQALLGRQFRVSTQRGEFVNSELAPYVSATVHPSSILRAPDEESRREQREQFVKDLKKIAAVI